MSGLWRLRVDVSERRVRGVVGGRVLVDSARPRLVHETGRHPTYWFPPQDVAWDLLTASPTEQTSPTKGPRRSWHLVDGRRDAVWTSPQLPAAAQALTDLVRVGWDAVDSWYEEDEQLFGGPRDPYRRVDALRSSRHVRVEVAGRPVAESTSPVAVFETGLPTRWYLPAASVDWSLLRPSSTSTTCQYKGVARYWDAVVGGELHADVAWSYPLAVPAVTALAGLVAFDGPAVRVRVDEEEVARPRPVDAWLNPSLQTGPAPASPALLGATDDPGTGQVGTEPLRMELP